MDTRRRRTPHGVRGLKFEADALTDLDDGSHPSRGAWIEIAHGTSTPPWTTVAPLTGCVD